jgi:hypothetical protein
MNTMSATYLYNFSRNKQSDIQKRVELFNAENVDRFLQSAVPILCV